MLMIWIVIIALSLIALAYLGLILSPFHRSTFRDLLSSDTPTGYDGPLPAVTVIVPARNEAEMLPGTLPTICRQHYPDLRVIAVDDQSDDDTPAVLENLKSQHANLTVIRTPEKPAEWVGKNWAVQQGVLAGTTDWLLFTDADVIYHPRAVEQAVRFALGQKLDLISVFPRCTFGSFWETVGVTGLIGILSMLFPTGLANHPKVPIALASGGFILVRRQPYTKTGGHEALRSFIIEDVNLAKRMKASGAAVHCRLTPDLLTTRMYEGFAEMWEGLTKNAYAGMEFQPRKFWVGMFAGIVGSVLPPTYIAGCAIWYARTGSAPALAALCLSILVNLLMIVLHSRTTRFLRLPWYHALLLPLASGLYTLIAAASFWQNHFGAGNTWKGRTYDRKMLTRTDATKKLDATS